MKMSNCCVKHPIYVMLCLFTSQFAIRFKRFLTSVIDDVNVASDKDYSMHEKNAIATSVVNKSNGGITIASLTTAMSVRGHSMTQALKSHVWFVRKQIEKIEIQV